MTAKFEMRARFYRECARCACPPNAQAQHGGACVWPSGGSAMEGGYAVDDDGILLHTVCHAGTYTTGTDEHSAQMARYDGRAASCRAGHRQRAKVRAAVGRLCRDCVEETLLLDGDASSTRHQVARIGCRQ